MTNAQLWYNFPSERGLEPNQKEPVSGDYLNKPR